MLKSVNGYLFRARVQDARQHGISGPRYINKILIKQMVVRILVISLIASMVFSCGRNTPEARCIQFVHIGTSDKLSFSSVITVDEESWCQIAIEYSSDTISIVKTVVDHKAISKIASFLKDSDYSEETPNGSYSGYGITIEYDDESSLRRFILSREENDKFFSELLEYVSKEGLSNDLIEFIVGIQERGYFFYG